MSRAKGVSNATRVTIVEYGPDTVNNAHIAGLFGFYQRAMRGLTGIAYTGDKGHPSKTFNGTTTADPQRFTGASGLAANSVVYRENQASLENGTPDAPYAAPMTKMFADQLAART